VFTRAKDGERSIESSQGGAARARLPFITRHIYVTEIDAPCPLQQISTSGRHIAQLR
jgi:hypothetical protein